jgi:hypothetical protein
MVRRAVVGDRRPMDDDADIIAEIRDRLRAHGEPADDYTDDELRAALRVTILVLALEYEGERIGRPVPGARSPCPP